MRLGPGEGLVCPGPKKEGDGCRTELAKGSSGAPRRGHQAPLLTPATGGVRVMLLETAKVEDPMAMATHCLGSQMGEIDGGALPAALHRHLLDASESGPTKPHERVIFNPQS